MLDLGIEDNVNEVWYDPIPFWKKFQVVVEDNNISKQDKGINVCWKLKIAFLYSLRLLFQFMKIKIRNIYNDALCALDFSIFYKLFYAVDTESKYCSWEEKGKYM